MTKNISIAIAFLTGLGLIFIGARFLIIPETAEAGYGIHFNEQSDYAFHYIKGIRDLMLGLLLCIFVLSKQTKALGTTLLVGTIVPIVDMFIVLSKPYNDVAQAIPHISAIIICFLFGIILLTIKPKSLIKTQEYINLISSADTSKESVLEMNILPAEKTPWHYHTLFSETFEILKGTLEVGKGKDILYLKQGDIATIQPNEKHYYHNISNEECIVKATLDPGNKNFENSIFILKGLAKDGLASVAGTPKKFSDLAIFVYLNNSRMVGFQKIAEPIFDYVAKEAIKKGYLNELIEKYCKETT
jgi:quercetin dioxygenase-like cupin family protein